MALRHLDPAGDAGALQNPSALVRLRIPVGAAIPEPAVLAPDGAVDLRPVPDSVRPGEGAAAEEAGAIADADRIAGLRLDGEPAFLSDLGPRADGHGFARGDDAGAGKEHAPRADG